MWTIVTIFFLVNQARAEGWGDFTNNLATDLAPLVALFGEQATKQFLSESISRLDNIIFAVAPLGILTAVVSVIRVLGSASLRAFVGRAQEGRGQAEAELCSSTSYDVCELWNNGGIARVFGRPQILEFIFDEREVKEHRQSQDTENNSVVGPLFYESFAGGKVSRRPLAGLYKPQEYVQKFNPPERAPPKEKLHGSDGVRPRFAPNPNLSLNVGIKKPDRIALYSAAIFGCLLQASVLCYGAWAIYIKGLRKEGQSAVDPYFWLTVTGTLLLVAGMFLCARLIEQSTQERTFTLQKQMFWLQPGNQRVGDQNFEAFAYSTNLEEYTTSWKEEREGLEWRIRVLVWSAISTSMIGFVLQFTGLRGLHSSVAMYQFVATLIMALIRSILRTQRLKESENLLRAREFQGQIEGHELDWQTLRIQSTIKDATETILSSNRSSIADPFGDTASGDELCWSIVEEPHNLEEAKITQLKAELVNQLKIQYKAKLAVKEDGSAAWTSCLEPSVRDQDEYDRRCANALIEWIAGVEGIDPASTSRSQSPNIAKKLLCYRSRLSYLTNDDAPTVAQRWGLPVREQATKLQAAIQSVANYVFSDACQAEIHAEWGTTAAFCWAVNCDTARRPVVPPLPVHLMVRRVRGQWRIDVCQLEAVLGLWTWSIKTEVEKHKKDERTKNEEIKTEEMKSNKSTNSKRGAKLGEHIEIGEDVAHERMGKDYNEENRGKKDTDYDLILSRKIFTLVPIRDLEARRRAERELNIWVLREQRQPLYDNLDTQALADSKRSKRTYKAFPSLSLPMTKKLLFKSNTEQQEDQQQQGMGLLSVQTENSVLVMAAQDIFTSFIDALASITSQLEGVNIVQSLRSNAIAEEVVSTSKARPFLGLAHNHTERLVDLFIQAGLGTRDDALLSVIIPFQSRSLLPSLVREYEQLKTQARKLRGDGRWEQAENLLVTLCDEVECNSRDRDTPHRSEELLRELGELYRKAMRSTDQSHRSFGYRGVSNMLAIRVEETVKTKEIRQNYSWVALELAKLHNDVEKFPAGFQAGHESIFAVLQSRVKMNRSFLSAGVNTLEDAIQLESAYPVGLLIAEQFKEQIEKETQSLRTQILIWAAQRGCKELVEDLLCAGLDVNVHDEKRRTPLSYACERGCDELSKYLIQEGATNTTDEESRTPFTWAVKEGRAHLVRQFLKMNIDVELKDKYERTPLSLAAQNGHEAVVMLLLETSKVDVNSMDKEYKRTPLSFAAQNGNEAVVKLLLKTSKIDVDSKDKNHGQTPLSLAAENGHEAIVKLLLETGKVDVDSKNNYGQTSLSLSARKGNEAIVKLLLETGKVDVDSKNKNYEQTPLSLAAEKGHEAVVKLLLETGKVDVDSKDKYEWTPLLFAAQNGNEAVVKLLLETGKVDVDSKNNYGQTSLSLSAWKGNEAIVKLLLETGKVDVDSKNKNYEQTPLSLAVENGHEAIVKLLLETGKVNVDSKDESGQTPLLFAALKGNETVVKLLLETSKVDVDSKDKYGRTPLLWAAQNRNEVVVKLLLETGKVDVDSKDEYEQTPLSLAADKGHEAIVKLLLETGKVNVNSKDESGRTPVSLAAKKGHEAVVKLLLDKGSVT